MAEITVKGNKVFLHDIVLEDPEITRAFEDTPEPERADFLKTVIRMGVLARTAATDGFKAEELASKIQGIVSGTETSVDKIRVALEAKVESLLKDAQTHVSGMINQTEQKVSDLKKLERTKSRTSQAGREYEQAVCDELAKIAEVYGAHCENAGDVEGKFGKKGDCWIQFEEGRVVFEIKKGAEPDSTGKRKKFTMRDVKDELTGAAENREADYGVFVTRDVASLPNEIHVLGVVGGQHMACGLEDGGDPIPKVLLLVCQMARIRMAAQAPQPHNVNVAKIEASCAKAQDALSDAHKQCRSISSAAKYLEGTVLEKILSSITAILESTRPADRNPQNRKP